MFTPTFNARLLLIFVNKPEFLPRYLYDCIIVELTALLRGEMDYVSLRRKAVTNFALLRLSHAFAARVH